MIYQLVTWLRADHKQVISGFSSFRAAYAAYKKRQAVRDELVATAKRDHRKTRGIAQYGVLVMP